MDKLFYNLFYKLKSQRTRRWFKVLTIGAVLSFLILIFLWLTVFRNTPIVTPQTNSNPGSSLSNITLTEFDETGKLVWEITAKRADYRQDRRIADVRGVSGKFYRDGKPIIEATGSTGTLDQVTQVVTLAGQVKALAVEENITMQSAQMTWESKKDLLTATGDLQIQNQDPKTGRLITITGKSLQAKPGTNIFTLEKDVLAIASKPPLEIRTDKITWSATKKRVFSESPIQVLQTKDAMKLTAKAGEWQLEKNLVIARGNVIAEDKKLDLQINAAEVQWDIERQQVSLPEAFQAASASRGITIKADKGLAQLNEQSIELVGNVNAGFTATQGTVSCDRVEWKIPSQSVIATGNLSYEQPQNSLRISGQKAVANLEEQSVQVTGEVISEFVP
ncbi:MAG: LPS export ABC transporter periplasmic protein LptC [Pseudanabaena sp. ELA607]